MMWCSCLKPKVSCLDTSVCFESRDVLYKCSLTVDSYKLDHCVVLLSEAGRKTASQTVQQDCTKICFNSSIISPACSIFRGLSIGLQAYVAPIIGQRDIHFGKTSDERSLTIHGYAFLELCEERDQSTSSISRNLNIAAMQAPSNAQR